MPPGLTLDRVGRLAEREQPGDGDAHQCRNPGCSRREALTHPGQGRHRPRDWLAEYLDYDSSIFRCYEPYRKRTLARLVLVCYYSHASYMTANSLVLVNFQTFLVGGIFPSNWLTGPDHKPVWRNGIRACLKNKSRKG